MTVARTPLEARRGLTIYFAVLIVGSGIVETLVIRTGEEIRHHESLIFLLMWMPAIASFVARAVRREGIADVSFRFGGRQGLKILLLAPVMPLIVGPVAYGLAWATGLVGYKTPSHGGFLPYLGLSLIIGATLGVLSGAGEEIGWRGYMLTRLIDAKVPRPLLVSGLIWAAWHLPLILSGLYAAGPHPTVSAAIFVVDVVGIAFVIGILRLRSGSVWPAALLHGEWNAIIQGPFDQSATGPSATVWVGESGILVAIVSLAVGLLAVKMFYGRDVRWPSADSSPEITSAGTQKPDASPATSRG